MQPVSSRIWTRVAVSIFYDDNHYTTGTSKKKVDNQQVKHYAIADNYLITCVLSLAKFP